MSARLKALLSRKDHVYLVLALTCGLVMALLNPPFLGVPDEHAHYWRAWAVLQGDLRCMPENRIPKSALELPSTQFPPTEVLPGVGRRVIFNKMIPKLFEEDTGELVVGGRAVCGSSPLGYLPQALGLRLGTLLHFSALGDFYLARIFNLIASALLVALAIRTAPFGKILLLVVALLPMTIQQFASLSYDGLNISLCFLYIAYVLKLSAPRDEPLRGRELAALFALGLLAFNAKLGYFGLALLVFLIPAARFRSRVRYWLSCTGFVAVQAAVFRVASRYLSSGDSGSNGIPGVNSFVQTAAVMEAPQHFLRLVYTTIYTNLQYYFETTLFKPGWLHASLPPLWYTFLVIGIVVLARNEQETVPLSRRQRYLVLGVFLVNLLAVFYAMYSGWTIVGSRRIEGVQGRYLLGFFPLLLLFFYKAGFSFRWAWAGKRLPALLVLFYLVLFAWMFSSLFGIYYDKEPKLSYVKRLQDRLAGRR